MFRQQQWMSAWLPNVTPGHNRPWSELMLSKKRHFSCNNGRCRQTQCNVGHTHRLKPQGELLSPPSISPCCCPHYLISTVLSKKATVSLARCISRAAAVEPVLTFDWAGFIRIDPFIPKWTLKVVRKTKCTHFHLKKVFCTQDLKSWLKCFIQTYFIMKTNENYI